jgi:uncharacterized protein (TIGR02757 family)
MTLTRQELSGFLEEKYNQYNHPGFIPLDPVSVPHSFTRKEDIEIAGFLTATISWGTRTSIVKDARALLKRMDCSPHEFLTQSEPSEFDPFRSFYHRTFNGEDCVFFLRSLRNIYLHHSGLEGCFSAGKTHGMKTGLTEFRKIFLEIPHEKRSEKHLPDPEKGSSCKRLNMFLRWMVRDDSRGVDFGLWKEIRPSGLFCPLDVHTARVARKLGLITRKQNDWRAVEELTANLRSFDPKDPVKYDFALFGLGIFEKF